MNDERIDQALKRLTGAEPPEGMEDRILRGVQQHRPAPSARRLWLIPACAFASCAVLAVAIGMRHRLPAPAAPAPTIVKLNPPGSVEQAAPQPAPQSAHQSAMQAATLHPHAARPSHAVLAEVSFPAPPAPLTEQEKLLIRLAHAREAEQFQAVASVQKLKEADVPLTHEEALLVAVSRVRQDAVIDALDPVRRALADAREKQEFNAFVHQKDGGS